MGADTGAPVFDVYLTTGRAGARVVWFRPCNTPARAALAAWAGRSQFATKQFAMMALSCAPCGRSAAAEPSAALFARLLVDGHGAVLRVVPGREAPHGAPNTADAPGFGMRYDDACEPVLVCG